MSEGEREKRCRWCRGIVTGRRRTFCSDECVHQWRLRSSTSYLRKCVLRRDRGICALCGIDMVAMRRSVMKRTPSARMQKLRELTEQGLIGHTRKSWWEADHILPVAEGGDSNLENLRTLCHPCHRGVTTELRLRRKRAGRSENGGLCPPSPLR